MASLSGVSSSNTVSSLMNSANMISGLASGLDTEGMIESLVKSYQTKITQLNQKVTKVEWKQDAYRSIINNLVGFSNKYTSYTSNTNLMSPSFFNSSVKVAVQSKNDAFKDAVTASGKTSSDISLNAVHQLATAAKYTTQGSSILTNAIGSGTDITGVDFDPNEKMSLSTLNGSMTLAYGGSNTISIQFDEQKDMDAIKDIQEKLGKDADSKQVLASLINQKLADQKITFNSGKSEAASERIEAKVKDGNIVFEEKGTAHNGVYISGASDSINTALNIGDLSNAKEEKPTALNLSGGDFQLTREPTRAEYLYEKSSKGTVTMNLNLDGTTKSVNMPKIVKDKDGSYKIEDGDKNLALNAENYAKVLNDSVHNVFGDKVKVSNEGNKLKFDVKEGSDLLINTSIGETLGLGNTPTTYLNTSKTLNDLFGKDYDGNDKMDNEDYLQKELGFQVAYEKDENGNFKLDNDGNKILLKDGKGNQMYSMSINGKELKTSFSKDSTLNDVLNAINSESDVKVSYSRATKEFLFTSKDTGSEAKIELNDGLASALFKGDRGSSASAAASDKFADVYGINLADGESKNITFSFSGSDITINNIKKDDSMEDIAQKLNKIVPNYGYTASYNELSGQILVTDKTGKTVDFKVKDGSKELNPYEGQYASNYTSGQDAIFNVTVNGRTMEMTRSSNSVSIDGLTINMQDTFNTKVDDNGNPVKDGDGKFAVDNMKDAVTFKSTTDSDKIVDAVKTMINEYNTMMSEIKKAYSTMPYQKSNGSFANYEPLTDEDREGMSESAIERYEEKAKQGILFGDRDLSSLYNKMRNAFSPAGENGALLRAMGISVSYSISDNAEAVTLDEDKLRAMLDSDPDKVAQVFTSSDGVMQTMKNTLDTYSRTTGEPKGILIQKAGSPLSALSLMNNTWQKEIDNYNTQIEKWQTKLENQVEKYTSQFARLEQLIQQMNSQSSTLAGMMGG